MMLPIARISTKAIIEHLSNEKLTNDEWDLVKEPLVDTSMEDTLLGQVQYLVSNVIADRNKELKVLESMVAELNEVSQKYGVSIRLVDVNNMCGKVYYFFPEFPAKD